MTAQLPKRTILKFQNNKANSMIFATQHQRKTSQSTKKLLTWALIQAFNRLLIIRLILSRCISNKTSFLIWKKLLRFVQLLSKPTNFATPKTSLWIASRLSKDSSSKKGRRSSSYAKTGGTVPRKTFHYIRQDRSITSKCSWM